MNKLSVAFKLLKKLNDLIGKVIFNSKISPNLNASSYGAVCFEDTTKKRLCSSGVYIPVFTVY